MSNLIPVKRLNKNGHLVTKHVKPTEAKGPERALPAPGVKSGKRPTDKAGYAKEIAEFLCEASDDEDRTTTAAAFAAYVGIRPLALIHARMHDMDEQVGEIVMDCMSVIITRSIKSNSPQTQRDRLVSSLVESAGVIRSFSKKHPNAIQAMEIITRADKAAKTNNVRIASERVTEDDRAAFRFIAFMETIGAPVTVTDKEKLYADAHWFDENAETLYLYGDELRERKSGDVEFLSSLISKDTSSSLSSGIL